VSLFNLVFSEVLGTIYFSPVLGGTCGLSTPPTISALLGGFEGRSSPVWLPLALGPPWTYGL